MGRRVALAVALLTLVVPGLAEGATRQLLPGVTYSRELRFTGAGPIVFHVLTAPKPGGLYALRPVLSNGEVAGRERVSSMQRRLQGRAVLAGVNADFFSFATGAPSGIYLRDGVMAARPDRGRSSVGIGPDGLLRVGRVGFVGDLRIEDGDRRRVFELNRPLQRRGVSLITPDWGSRTPANRRGVEVVLKGFPRARPNSTLHATVQRVRAGGRKVVPAGGAVLQARVGVWRETLKRARPGQQVTLRLGLSPWWSGVRNALGGGPVLVRNGRPILDADEAFSRHQLGPRHPRTAVGQRADGRIMLVAVDGRWSGSIGLRTWQLALEMARRGAVTAMAFDGGGSSTMAFDGQVLNRPSDGVERPVSDALMLFYYGAYAPPPRPVLSPNGDGTRDSQVLSAKLVRRSQVDLSLVRPDGVTRWRYRGTAGPGVLRKRVGPRVTREGVWRWIVEAVDGRGLPSRMERTFTVNNTLGFLSLSKERMRVSVKRRGGRLVASFNLTNRARVTARVLKGRRIVRTLVAGVAVQPARVAVVWDGRNRAGRVVRSGVFTIRIVARNSLGRVQLQERVVVRRVKAS